MLAQLGAICIRRVCTRPDILHAASVVSRYMANSGKTHWEAVTWILLYLKGTANVDLVFEKGAKVGGLVLGLWILIKLVTMTRGDH